MDREPEFRIYPLAPHLRVSRDGRVESCKLVGKRKGTGDTWRRLTVNPHSARGYPGVNVTEEDGKSRVTALHKIVANTWLGPKPGPGMLVRHLDDNKQNCHADNLSWGTAQENSDDAKANGKYLRKATPAHISLIKIAASLGLPLTEFARDAGISYAAAHYIANGHPGRTNFVERQGAHACTVPIFKKNGEVVLGHISDLDPDPRNMVNGAEHPRWQGKPGVKWKPSDPAKT